MILQVDTARLTLSADGVTTPCGIGRSGSIAAADKREGDGCTPLGSWPLRSALVRLDRFLSPTSPLPASPLPWRGLGRFDGWSDDPADAAYNTLVRLPHPFSAEELWRADGLYDIIVTLGYNDAPTVPGRGSAIFLHCTAPGHPFTAGCVAIDREALLALLPWLTPNSVIEIA